ncbi:hypothetical protein RB195_000738 [Necator americanus]|uniref:Glycosyltransferase family 92 protein n=1 Tax=Necator americanus TaxID=51031 RepID=A0ABR1DB46_NECAM
MEYSLKLLRNIYFKLIENIPGIPRNRRCWDRSTERLLDMSVVLNPEHRHQLLQEIDSQSYQAQKHLYCSLFCAFLVCSIFFGLFTGTPLNDSTNVSRIDLAGCTRNSLPENISTCVPFYELMRHHVAINTGNQFFKRNRLSVVAAYAYPNYSVVTIEADGWYGEKVYCRYFDRHMKELTEPVASIVFPEFAVHCCRHLRAEYMTVSEEKEQAITVAARIIDRISAKPQYTLSLCLAALYGNQSKWLLLAELVEHYKLQGVEHFYFYIKDIDQYSQKLVNDYVENGEAEVVYFRQEEDRLPEDWQHVSVQDCLQRSRHHSRYSIFGDLDERIIPLGKIRLVDYVLKKMGEKNNIGMIKFTPRFVLRTRKPPDNYEGTKTLSKNLPTLVFRNTSATPLGYYTKCILDPTRVLLQWVHNVKVYFPGYVGLEAPRNEVIIRLASLPFLCMTSMITCI